MAVNSNDAGNYPQDSFEKHEALRFANALPFPISTTRTNPVAKAYRAVSRPTSSLQQGHEAAISRAAGRIAQEIGPADLRRDLYEAMVMVAMFGKGPAEQQPSIGCTIK